MLSDCSDVMRNVGNTSGIYTIQPLDNQAPIRVCCESGWLVIQRRINGTVDFYQPWYMYRDGFGDLNSEFWLGNANIQRLTQRGRYELRVDLADFDGSTSYALYNNFSLSLQDNYRLTLGKYSGNAGYELEYNEGSRFSTYDRDLDDTRSRHCAQYHHGGWWYSRCTFVNLNGLYMNSTHKESTDHMDAIWWYNWRSFKRLKETVIKIRSASASDINCG